MKPFNIPWEEYRSKPDNLKYVTSKLIYMLDDMDSYVSGKLVVHCVVDADRPSSNYHARGMAADLHIDGLSVLDQFIVAGRFPFTGIGVYGNDVWHNPGLHVDVRRAKIGARWARIMDGKGLRYVPLDMGYFMRAL